METIGKFSSEPCEVALGSTVLRLEVPALCPGGGSGGGNPKPL